MIKFRVYIKVLMLLVCSTACNIYGQSVKDNIIIFSKVENYEFVEGSEQLPVLVKGQISTVYRCNGFRTDVPFYEVYNENTAIDELKIYVDGKLNERLKPTYDYLPINGVFYTDARVCSFMLPLEKKNSSSEVFIGKTINDPRYFNAVFLSEEYHLENKKISIKVPDWMKVEIKEYNFPATGISRETLRKGKSTIYKYTITQLPPTESLPDGPGISYVEPHLLVLAHSAAPGDKPAITYFETLQDLYDWYHALVKNLKNDVDEFRQKVQDIVANRQTDKDKIQAVYQWLQANIRYIAFEDGIAGYQPKPAQEVYLKRYGDCKGMANLAKEMLKLLGYDARLCWIRTNDIAYTYATPSLRVDNHVICAVKLNDRFTFLDVTEQYMGLGEYAERIQGAQVLIEDGERYILENVPTVNPIQNTISGKRLVKIDGDNIAGTVSLIYKGQSKENIHLGVNSVASQDRILALQQFLSGKNNNLSIRDVNIQGLEDWNKDIFMEFNFIYHNAVSEFGNEKYINLDLRNEFSDMEIDTMRKQDFWFSYKYHIVDTTELILPEGYSVATYPGAVHIQNDDYRFNLHYTLQDHKLIYTKEIVMVDPVIKKQQFKAWNADLGLLKKFYRTQVVLKKL